MWKGVLDTGEVIAAGGTDYLTFNLPPKVRKLRLSARNDTTTVSMFVELKNKGSWFPVKELTTTAKAEVVLAEISPEIELVGGQIRVGMTTSVAADVIKALLIYEREILDV